MAKLRFKAKEGHLVRVPGSSAVGFPRYVGIKINPETKEKTECVFECDSNSSIGQSLVAQVMRDDNLVCVDEETAALCGKQAPVTQPTKASTGGKK